MPADTLTKALGRTKVSLFRDVLLGTNTYHDRRSVESIMLIV